MASIQRHGAKWRVQVYADGKRDSKVFPTKQEASQWALAREAELTGRKLPDRSFADAMKDYARKVSPERAGGHWEAIRLKALQEHSIARRKLAGLGSDDFAKWRDDRLRDRKPGTVAREMNLMRAVLEVARRDWGWLKANPMTDVRWPKAPKGRARRISEDEIAAVVAAFGVAPLKADTATQRVGLAFLFAIETAMRSGEILSMRWPDVHLRSRYVHLPRTKNGDARDVPLSTRAVAILQTLPHGEGPVFGVEDRIRDALWRKYRPAHLADLHFHDTRAEAIWRLSKKLDVLQLAQVPPLRSLLIKGDVRQRSGDERAASSFYGTALKVAAQLASVPDDLKSELARAEVIASENAQRYRERLETRLAAVPQSDRFRESLALMFGDKQVYYQQPSAYYFPRLPQIQFYDPAQFAWAGAIEAASDDILAELRSVLGDEALFEPYLQPTAERPNDDFHGMLGNPDWSTLHLFRDGQPVAGAVERCPRTYEVLQAAPLCRITTRAPSILFSLLKAGARIPPHHGMLNTRLICHIPLVVPPNCALRVGSETRCWTEGELLIFDDSFEHEAWNRSGSNRIVLIFEIWRPEISLEERAELTALFEAIDLFPVGGASDS